MATLFLRYVLIISVLLVLVNTADSKLKKGQKSRKRQAHIHRHYDQDSRTKSRLKHEESILKAIPMLQNTSVVKDNLVGLYPDIRPCYEGIPRIYEKFAKERLEKRNQTCFEVNSNMTSWCYKECILLKLEYITRYTVTIMGSQTKQRRYKINQKSECGHNMFGQDLLGIDTKIWDEKRSQKERKEKELYFEKVNQLGIRNYDPDPFRLKFTTTHGEDIVDERLEAQMRICRLFDITVEDIGCADLSVPDMRKLVELLQCLETALTC